MNESKFWKIVYLYVNNYHYEVIHYRPEKKDIWLINRDNELVRFIYNSNIKSSDVDASVYNIIKNEQRLRKVFKLSSLKIKVLYTSSENDDSIQEYKKYKISNDLLIERIILSEKNQNKFIRSKDKKFVDLSVKTDRYKTRVVDGYLNKKKSNYLINFHFNFLAVVFILLFSINFLVLYYSNNSVSLYKFLEYNYQSIITGEFYRLFTNIVVFDNINQLIFITIFIFICSLLFGEEIKLTTSITILLLVTFVSNLFLLFGYSTYINSVSIAFFGLLGSFFIAELNKRGNDIKTIYTLALSVIYLVISSFYIEMQLGIYMFAFVLGIFLQLLMLNKINLVVSYVFVAITALSGILIILLGFDLKSKINNYNLSKYEKKILNNSFEVNTEIIEKELNSKNKSVLTYYELGLLKISTSSIDEAKKIFLDGINFDDRFAPLYYQLALIERAESNKSKSLEYIEKAINLDGNNNIYKNLKLELLAK
ncbi:hypothetical protein HZY83_04490 [Gemella sp. GH3]|uniref:hypothetical protein n=1 Tax=unclassified Gemella TaxID=2624949 RepID=UPI0015CF9051|nr:MULTISPECIES: hypothetical protein [unclassified Gemella]MBF0713939.1 hypothetical protein [Gemella sp. GH3.1]NYS50891.1 hypothetical protein [Gemella sp. GH3]